MSLPNRMDHKLTKINMKQVKEKVPESVKSRIYLLNTLTTTRYMNQRKWINGIRTEGRQPYKPELIKPRFQQQKGSKRAVSSDACISHNIRDGEMNNVSGQRFQNPRS